MPDLNKLPPDRQIIDHLRVVPRRKGRGRAGGKAHEVGTAAKFGQALVVFHVGFQRDGAGQRVLGKPRGGAVKDARMDRVIEMLRADDRGDAVENIVVRQNRAQQLLLCLD